MENSQSRSFNGVVVQMGDGLKRVERKDFSLEADLENIIANCPFLFGDSVKLVAKQVSLPRAGKLDLLFIDRDGLLIAVEVKLGRNSEARREVIGQVLDYLSDIMSFTVDELNDRLEGDLKEVVLEFLETDEMAEPDPEAFNRIWKEIGTNLRSGRARLVVALDEAPRDLERIFMFLARHSNLDVHLINLQSYFSPDLNGYIYVPRSIVSPKEDNDESVSTDGHSARFANWNDFLATVENPDLLEFAKDWLARNEWNSIKSVRFIYPAHKSKWRLNLSRKYIRVMQGGRFPDDKNFWQQRLAEPQSVHDRRDGRRLHFTLSTKSDFDAFWKAASQELKNVTLDGTMTSSASVAG